MRMSHAQWEQMIAHAQEIAPNECCGFLRARGGSVQEVHRGENLRSSPYGYELDASSLLRANQLDADGDEVAIYHSHPRSPAEPSQTDINLAYYPHWSYLIVSLQGEPHVRAWKIADGDVTEETITVG